MQLELYADGSRRRHRLLLAGGGKEPPLLCGFNRLLVESLVKSLEQSNVLWNSLLVNKQFERYNSMNSFPSSLRSIARLNLRHYTRIMVVFLSATPSTLRERWSRRKHRVGSS